MYICKCIRIKRHQVDEAAKYLLVVVSLFELKNSLINLLFFFLWELWFALENSSLSLPTPSISLLSTLD